MKSILKPKLGYQKCEFCKISSDDNAMVIDKNQK